MMDKTVMDKTAPVFVFLLFLLLGQIAFAQEGEEATWNEYVEFDSSKMQQAWDASIAQLNTTEPGGIMNCAPAEDTLALGQELVKNAFFALFIVAMAIGLLYMAGSFFQLQNLLALSKQELNELALTALVAVVFVGFLVSINSFGYNFSQKAMEYSYKMLYKVSKYSAVLISANIALNSIYTLYVPLGPVRKALTIQLGPALRPLIDGVSFSLQFLITTFGEWIVFIFIFCFIQKWFLPFFFPAGLFLRSFPQTRAAGSTLIALAFSLSTIYPFMFYLDGLIFDKQFPPETTISVQYFLSTIKALIMQLTIVGAASIFGALSFVFVSPVMVAAILMASYMFVDMVFEVLHLIVIFSMLLPILNIFVTLSLTREIARLLGTEVNISAFAKLI